MSCRRQRKRIDALFLGELSPSGWRDLTGHLKTCEGCAHYYDRAALAMRALSGRPGEVTPEELAPIGASLRIPLSGGSRWLGRLTAVLAVAASTAAVATFVLRRPTVPAGEVTARGESTPIDVQIRSYCLREAAPGQLTVVGASSEASGALSCGINDYVQFSCLLRGARPMYLYLVGQDAAGGLHHYYPRTDTEASLRIDPTGREEPLPGSIRLSAKHQPGVVQVAAVVSDSPLNGDAVLPLLGQQMTVSPSLRILRLSLAVTQ
jgi:hypothetical protein